jgi:gamma-glutamyltranspeptidase/glutathione hydrolase
LNILEGMNLSALGHNSARYIHALYQAMSLAFADRDFYYGDPDFPPEEPIRALLSKDYARQRLQLIDWSRNNPDIRPGDPYAMEGREHPFRQLLDNWSNVRTNRGRAASAASDLKYEEAFRLGTTSIQAADTNGWAISVTPSGGWLPVCIAGNTGVGMSQRMQSFVLDEAENPYNVVAPGKRPRVTLTPSIAMKDGRLFLCFSVQGGDTQDQNLLQFFLNMVEFGMTVQEACEAPNIISYQMRTSFDQHEVRPGRIMVNNSLPPWARRQLSELGYRLEYQERSSGPITAIYFDQEHGSFWGGASNDGEDYGIAW